MMKRIRIGMIGVDSEKIEKYEKQGYSIISIYDQVDAFAKKLIANREFSEEELDRVRTSGYKNSAYFWVGLIIVSCYYDEKVVITDLNGTDDKRIFDKIL